ncbi:NAD dependent epimerase/dehydratase family protein [Rhizodiscina lignyota]|uniref:NAD dependent epimerase/dehydratase family protein n=1 Tax=Rhizodiscina lignyota TaxID=1504668 RepID=A0A9P4IB95_9PEZI|nr:NAD dependent epimerase/dehydratase family protein [Rhizodiscina lignyota]
MPSAIVTGATGILGRAIVHELSAHAQQWPTVHALSRSKTESYPSNVIHNHVDLTSPSKEMAEQLAAVKGEYLFFSAYLQQDSEQANFDVNGDMLEAFLNALDITGASKTLKRIILVTGAKQYGVHLGAAKCPMMESDRWVVGDDRPPNFYYRQQDILRHYCQDREFDWVVTYPNDVIGLAKGNFMNLATSVGLYAAVTKELGSGELPFPGSEIFYTKFDSFTVANLHAKFCAWAALEPRAGNEAFNVVNGDIESWQNLWPRLAQRYGLKVPPDQFERSADMSSEMLLAERPPLDDWADELGLRGKVRQNKVQQRIDLVKWSQKEEVKEGWEKLADREGLEKDAFEKATWEFLAFVLGRDYDIVISMSKARKLGWSGYADTWESLEEALGELEVAKVLPKAK